MRLPAKARVGDAVLKQFDPCNKKSKLGWASRNYYSEFLAVLHAEAYRNLFYGEMPMPLQKPVAFRRIETPETALSFAMANGISLQEFRFYNPDVRNLHRRLPKGFLLAVPGETDDLGSLIVHLKPLKPWRGGSKS